MQFGWEVLSFCTFVAARFAARSTAGWIARSSTSRFFAARFFTATVNDFVTAQFQRTFSFATDTAVTVSQSAGQGGNDFGSAAAAVFASLIADFISGLLTDTVVSVIKSVDEGSHDLRVTLAVEFITDFVDGFGTVLGIAGCL